MWCDTELEPAPRWVNFQKVVLGVLLVWKMATQLHSQAEGESQRGSANPYSKPFCFAVLEEENEWRAYYPPFRHFFLILTLWHHMEEKLIYPV